MEHVLDEHAIDEKTFTNLAEKIEYLHTLYSIMYEQLDLCEFEHTSETSYERQKKFHEEKLIVADLMLESGSTQILAYLISWKMDRETKAIKSNLEDTYLSVETVILNYEVLWKALGYYKGLQRLVKSTLIEIKEVDQKDQSVTFKLFKHLAPSYLRGIEDDVKTEDMYELRYNHIFEDEEADVLEVQPVTKMESTFKEMTKKEYMLRKTYMLKSLKCMKEKLKELHLLLERGKEAYLEVEVEASKEEKRDLKFICEEKKKEAKEAGEKLKKLREVHERKMTEVVKKLKTIIDDLERKNEELEAEKNKWFNLHTKRNLAYERAFSELNEKKREVGKQETQIEVLKEEKRKLLTRIQEETTKQSDIQKKDESVEIQSSSLDVKDNWKKMKGKSVVVVQRSNLPVMNKWESINDEAHSEQIAKLNAVVEELRMKISEKEQGGEYLQLLDRLMKLKGENEELKTEVEFWVSFVRNTKEAKPI